MCVNPANWNSQRVQHFSTIVKQSTSIKRIIKSDFCVRISRWFHKMSISMRIDVSSKLSQKRGTISEISLMTQYGVCRIIASPLDKISEASTIFFHSFVGGGEKGRRNLF